MLDTPGPLGKHIAASPSLIGEIVTDLDLRIESASFGYYALYDVEASFAPETIHDVVEERAARGWIGLGEALDERPVLDARLNEIRARRSHTALQVSPEGNVIAATHATCHESSRVRFHYASTGVQLVADACGGPAPLALKWLCELQSGSAAVSRLLPGLLWSNDDEPALNFVCDRNGEFVLTSRVQGDLDAVAEARSLHDMSPQADKAIGRVLEHGAARLILESSSGPSMLLSLRRVEIGSGGPSVLSGQIRPFLSAIDTEAVHALCPNLTLKEAEVVAALAAGETIKGAAHQLGKSDVTVAFQTRSALRKMGYRTVEQMASRVAVFCLAQ